MRNPTLNELSRYLEFLDTNDEAAMTAYLEGVIDPYQARTLLETNAKDRVQYLDQAFQMAHAQAHAAKCAAVLTLRKAA